MPRELRFDSINQHFKLLRPSLPSACREPLKCYTETEQLKYTQSQSNKHYAITNTCLLMYATNQETAKLKSIRQ